MEDHERINSYKEIVETEVAKTRIAQLLDIAADFYPEPVQDLFVSEHREKDGRQIIQSVYLFTQSHALEFKNPLQENEETFDLAITKDAVVYFEASKKDFDLHRTRESSRFTFTFVLIFGTHGNLRASGKNCLNLLRIVKERFVPNVATRAHAGPPSEDST